MNNKKLEAYFASLVDKAKKCFLDNKKSDIPYIYIGMATCGLAAGAVETKAAFAEALAERHIEARILPVGCLGHCYAEPLVLIDNPGFPPIYYHNVNPGKAGALVRAFLEGGDPLFEHVLGAGVENELIPAVMDFPRFNLERRIVMEECGLIDPEDISQCIAKGGYSGLFGALALEPDEVIREVLASGLRGRGGAGFPTGRKWEFAGKARGQEKTVICNADEGDPGAYMDRTIMESNPHQLLEGIAICAYAVGAQKAIIYVRAEYPLAVKTMTTAISQAKENGLLGKEILGTNFNLEVSLFHGSGAFVCGEETALIQSIEGKRGMPQYRPPYPVQAGLWGKPTVINNVKTLSSLPAILKRGAKKYREMGTSDSPGTAIFSVVGKVVHPGLVEIPMGTSLRTLIFDICGGVPEKKQFKAVQIGGPSGGCLPDDFLDTPIDFDSLTQAGAMMGSGGMVVLDEGNCVVDVARYFLDFTQKESCGKCTFCRIGTRHLLAILERLTKGEGREGDLELLTSLSRETKEGSLCGLGKTAPNPVLTSLKYFRDEYEAHFREKRCPAMVCRALTAFYIDLDRCARGCDACVGSCPVEAIFTTRGQKKGVDQSLC
ncbi:MAG: NADH-quinone oxidoreductase subunit NuoF, partial [Syntrophales bacterium]|nr:NADH-quinone oxidoreductase subunit NuoF [Syntrophales bacterium]